jgi:hypothetical protein
LQYLFYCSIEIIFINLFCYNEYFLLEQEERNTEKRREKERRGKNKDREENENDENG